MVIRPWTCPECGLTVRAEEDNPHKSCSCKVEPTPGELEPEPEGQ